MQAGEKLLRGAGAKGSCERRSEMGRGKWVLLASLGIFLLPRVSAAVPMEISTRITAVTVYTDRAEIQREGKVTLGSGATEVVFPSLPASIDQSSIQVSGTGNAVLENIHFERKHLIHSPSRKEKSIRDSLLVLNDSSSVLDAIILHAGHEKEFVLSIAKRLTHGAEKEAAPVLDPEKWSQMVAFYRGRLDSLDRQVRDAQKYKRSLRQDIDRLQRELNEIVSARGNFQNQVTATVRAARSGQVILRLSYIVSNARWRPGYDIRVDSENQKLVVEYKGRISQNTSESWENVKVILSTAQPSAGDGPPELSPWYLSFRAPVVADQRPRALGRAKAAAPSMEMAELRSEFASAESDELTVATSTAENRVSSVVFVPKAKTTVANDNSETSVIISSLTLPATFSYTAIPKFVPRAYLKATTVNASDFPLLAGETNVYLDGSFVTDGHLEYVAPSEEFQTLLGADDGVAVEHKLIKRYEKKEGVLAKKREIIYEYKVTIENKKTKQISLAMADQIPIPTNAEIAVNLISPKKDQDKVKISDQNYLEWELQLTPGQKKEIPLTFSVVFPIGKELQGL